MKDERVQPDFSVEVVIGQKTDRVGNIYHDKILVDRTYDHIHLFNWLGYSLLKLITEDGVYAVSMPQESGLAIAEKAGIVPIMRTEISEREYQQYLGYQESMLGDNWL